MNEHWTWMMLVAIHKYKMIFERGDKKNIKTLNSDE